MDATPMSSRAGGQELQEFRSSGVQEFRSSGVQEYWSTGCWGNGVLEGRAF